MPTLSDKEVQTLVSKLPPVELEDGKADVTRMTEEYIKRVRGPYNSKSKRLLGTATVRQPKIITVGKRIAKNVRGEVEAQQQQQQQAKKKTRQSRPAKLLPHIHQRLFPRSVSPPPGLVTREEYDRIRKRQREEEEQEEQEDKNDDEQLFTNVSLVIPIPLQSAPESPLLSTEFDFSLFFPNDDAATSLQSLLPPPPSSLPPLAGNLWEA